MNSASNLTGTERTDFPLSNAEELSLNDFIHIIRKHYLLFLLTVCLITIGGVVLASRLQPVYKATATISIDRPPVISSWWYYSEEQSTKSIMGVLNSRLLLEKAVERSGVASSAMRNLILAASKQSESPLIDISIEDKEPGRVLAIFESFLPLAAESLSKNEGQILIRRVEYLRAQMKIVEERIQRTDQELQAFAQKENDISLTEKCNKVNGAIQKLKDDRRNGEGELIVLGNLLKDLQERTHTVSGITGRKVDTTIQELVELKTSLFQLQRERIKFMSMYKEGHPDLKSLDNQIVFVNAQIQKISVTVNPGSLQLDSNGQVDPYVFQRLIDLEQQQKTLILRIAQMDLALTEKQDIFQGLLTKLAAYNQVVRRQKLDEQLHSSLVEKMNQAELEKATSKVAVNVTSAPFLPTISLLPQRNRYILFGILLGLIAGGLLAYVRESMDNSLKSPEDAEASLGLVNLGSLPDMKALLTAPVADPDVEISQTIVTFHHRTAIESESFRKLRTTLKVKAKIAPFKSLLVTSWGQNLGKSTVAANLAMVYAQSGVKVILVDGDLHKPTVHHFFFKSNHRGLTDFILGEHLEKVLQPTAQSNLFVIPSGPLPPNPSEILGSDGMEVAMKHLVAAADLVIFDMPPLMAVADAAVLADKVDAVLYLVPIGKESRRFAAKGLEILRLVKAPIIGMFCTFLKKHQFEGYSYHYHV